MSPARFTDILWTVVLAIVCGAAVFGIVFFGFSCTPAQQQTLGNLSTSPATVTTLKIASCIQGAMAEEEQQRLRDRREAERQAEEEAEAIKDAAREHSPTTAEEVEKVLR